MASLEKRGSRFRLIFRYGGRKYQHPLKTELPREAEACRLRVEENLRLLERGRITLTPAADLPTFLMSDGKLSEKPKVVRALTLGDFRDHYFASRPEGSWEKNTQGTVRSHFGHVVATFGEEFAVQSLGLADLQRHVNRRAQATGFRGRALSATTIKKEVATFRAAWNWAVASGLLTGPFPNRGLLYPKGDEKARFVSFAEVNRRLALGSLTPAAERDLWECVYLSVPETFELLECVRTSGGQPFVYPMACTAALTGMRRSELIRAEVADVDLETRVITVRERKKAKGLRTTRRVPVSPFLAGVLKEWLATHPGSPYLFAQPGHVVRSKTKHGEAAGLTKDEANDHFKRALVGSRFARLKGWHVLRHSFVSNCAARGTDQRLIDEWVGHTTEDMRRRYRHLFPDQQKTALELVFAC